MEGTDFRIPTHPQSARLVSGWEGCCNLASMHRHGDVVDINGAYKSLEAASKIVNAGDWSWDEVNVEEFEGRLPCWQTFCMCSTYNI